MWAKSALRRLLGPPRLEEVGVVRRVLPKRGVMVDVGAHHGGSLLGFARSGWTVFGFEPDPRNRNALIEATRDLPNVVIDPRAVTESDGAAIELFMSDLSSGISSLRAFHETHRQSTTVLSVRLDTYLRAFGVRHVDFLKVDAEGFDLPVLRTFPWQMSKPLAVVTEFEDRKTLPLGYSVHDLAQFLVEQGYAVLVSEWYPVVRYGGTHAWRRLAVYPTEMADPKSWGNLVAVQPQLLGRTRRSFALARLRLRVAGRVRQFWRWLTKDRSRQDME